ncbi:M16 family metallopeptidase [Thioalbus denitrificans]|uniref:Zinc protease n=1 Tax=Thioalbus denitrificans TaxID=547122 RepID=A0A369CJN3_9GAMM|nr:pitrilysin family protein [Thioalbus denitrificans]RCX33285.1 zinc protease [Thioalbus denitrificans]
MSNPERTNAWLAALLLLFLLLPLPALAAPDIQHWETGNGARVYFVPTPALPMVDVRVVFDAGSARNDGHGGLATLVNGLLAEGAGGLDADTIAARLESVGAQLDNDALRDMAVVSLRSLTDPELLAPAVATFATLLAQPDFPDTALERVRQQMLVALEQERQDPAAQARNAWYRAVYGDHPYAAPTLGTPESVNALTRAQVVAFQRRFYVARNAVVAIVGDLDRGRAEALADQVIGRLPAGEPAPPLPPVAALTAPRSVTVAFPSAQTHVLVGQPGIDRRDPDYFPLYVGNHILGGGGFTSRLTREVRDERGLSYSVYSAFVPMRARGPFLLGLQTRNDQAGEALTVLNAVLDKFVAGGPTAAELEAAKRNITGGFPLRIDSNANIVEYLALIGFYRLPLDYLDTFNDRVEAVTAAQVRAAFARRVHPDRLVTVTVGGGGEG